MRRYTRSRGVAGRPSLVGAVAAMILAVVVLVGCGRTGPESVDLTLARTGPATSGDGPLKVRGVRSCQVLSDMAIPGIAATSEEELESITFPCLLPGPPVDLSQVRGKVMVINLWATWCGPCREEMPILQAASERFGDDVQFVGVVTKDSTTAAAGFLPLVGTTYPQLLDADAELLASLRIPGLPVTVVLDPAGTIVKKQIGAIEADDLDSLLSDLVGAT